MCSDDLTSSNNCKKIKQSSNINCKGDGQMVTLKPNQTSNQLRCDKRIPLQVDKDLAHLNTLLSQASKYIMTKIRKKSKYEKHLGQVFQKPVIVKRLNDLVHSRLLEVTSKKVLLQYKDIVRHYLGMFPRYVDEEVKKIMMKDYEPEQPSDKIALPQTDKVIKIFQKRIHLSLRQNMQEIINNIKYYESEKDILKCIDQLPNIYELSDDEQTKKNEKDTSNAGVSLNKLKVDSKQNTEYRKKILQEYYKIIDDLLTPNIADCMKTFKGEFESILNNDKDFIKAQAKIIIESKNKLRDKIYAANSIKNDVHSKIVVINDKNKVLNEKVDVINDKNDVLHEKIDVINDKNKLLHAKIVNNNDKVDIDNDKVKVVDGEIEIVENEIVVDVDDDSDVEIIENEVDIEIIHGDTIFIEDDEDIISICDGEPTDNAKKQVPQPNTAPKVSKNLITSKEDVQIIKDIRGKGQIEQENKGKSKVVRKNVTLMPHSNSQLFAMVIGRPKLPPKSITLEFLRKFNPGQINRHLNVVNVLLVSFNNKKDFGDILKANGSCVGDAVLIIKAWNPVAAAREGDAVLTIKAWYPVTPLANVSHKTAATTVCHGQKVKRKIDVSNTEVTKRKTVEETCKVKKIINIFAMDANAIIRTGHTIDMQIEKIKTIDSSNIALTEEKIVCDEKIKKRKTIDSGNKEALTEDKIVCDEQIKRIKTIDSSNMDGLTEDKRKSVEKYEVKENNVGMNVDKNSAENAVKRTQPTTETPALRVSEQIQARVQEEEQNS